MSDASGKKVALVTGAMGGIGTAICKSLAADGYIVVANCLPNFAPRADWEKAMKADGVAYQVAEGDVSCYDSCQKMVEHIESTVGGIDIVVNNAGITRDAMFKKMDKKMWDDVLSINLDSYFNLNHHIVPKMADRGWGRVINISSVNGVKGQFGQTNYSAAKAGILGFTKALAQEVAKKGVTVNAIAPGYIGTEMVLSMKPEIVAGITAQVPVGRLGKPEEIGALVSYLASDLAGFVTGATININGGLHMC